ncbi:MAG: nucleotidyltransferase domain-containing protein [bacterium]|nr:nucleotidyltransferase domain-containing protein [bacterium]
MNTLDEISLSHKDRGAVQAAAAILRERFRAERVVLFGSKARGDDDTESDIDLLVLTERPLTDAEKTRVTDALFGLQLELEVVISTLVVPTEEWQHGLYQVLPIRHEIEREGVAA